MKRNTHFVYFFLATVFVIASCTGTRPGLFSKKAPQAAYLSGLKDAGLAGTRLGKLFEQAAANSLSQPVSIVIPYKETGYFEPDNPRAMGYLVRARRGEQLVAQITTQPASGFLLFVELWGTGTGQSPQLLVAADTGQRSIKYTIQKEGSYIVRVQPELLQGISYTLSVSTAPSLAFPLNKNDKPRIISVWGVDRDAGARKHEGIDILVKKHTPAVAAAAGYVSSVSENNLGGRVVFLSPEGMNVQLYYAHLDTQWVRTGQRVLAGDTLGLTGNTGNARNTVSHLHFGIYTSSGAVNPLPFIETERPLAQPVKADTGLINRYVRIQKDADIPGNSVAKIVAAADNRFLLELPDSRRVFAPSSQVTVKPVKNSLLSAAASLFEQPDSLAAVKKVMAPGTNVSLLGFFKEYCFISWKTYTGWIKRSDML